MNCQKEERVLSVLTFGSVQEVSVRTAPELPESPSIGQMQQLLHERSEVAGWGSKLPAGRGAVVSHLWRNIPAALP